jgi:hypothetical protein
VTNYEKNYEAKNTNAKYTRFKHIHVPQQKTTSYGFKRPKKFSMKYSEKNRNEDKTSSRPDSQLLGIPSVIWQREVV